MKPSHERHLRVLSAIEEDILDPTTEQRAQLFEGRAARRAARRRPLIVSTAAGLVAAILLMILLPILLSDRPVYRGMSVSGAASPSLSAITEEDGVMTRTHSAERRFGKGNGNGNENGETPDDLNPIGDTYFATPGEDILIYVHIDNPKNYEILSFTLNGTKYSSYMFEEGSTMELLILKVNVGTVEGVKDYTIDAIKYVDGEAIKDVRMRGERTIKVGVAYNTSVQTEVRVTEATYDTLTVKRTVRDDLKLTEDRPMRATLYDGERVIVQKELTADTKTTQFDGLSPCRSYRLLLEANYDDLLGDGERWHTLVDTYVSTLAFFTAETVGGADAHAVLTPTDPAFTLVRIETVKDATASAADASHVPLHIGDNVLRITYRQDGKEHTTEYVLPLSVAKSDLYTINKFYSTSPVWNESTADWRAHPGLDLYPTDPSATEVVALVEGIVIDEYDDYQYGRTVVVSAVIDGNAYRVLYQNLSSVGAVAKVGDRLKVGDFVGFVGDTAMWEVTEEAHLHLCVQSVNGEMTFNPYGLIYR